MKKITSFLLALFVATQVYADSIITGSKPFTFIPGTVISSSQVNADFDYIINQVNTNAAKNGVNSSITALLGLTTPIGPDSGGSPVWDATTVGGTANAITVSATRPAISSFSYTKGNIVTIIPASTSTGPATIDINGLGVEDIFKPSDAGVIALTGGELTAGVPSALYYDGTQFVVITLKPYFGTMVDVASAATVNLGLIGSHVVNLTGTTTISSFGTSATATAPLYYVQCGGAITITGSSSLFLPSGTSSGSWICNSGDTFTARFFGSGWRIDTFERYSASSSTGVVNRVLVANNSATPTTQIDIFYSSAILCNSTGYCIGIDNTASPLTIDATTTGANGLDTGSLANNTWYAVFVISNGSTTAGLLSTSEFAPTMPAEYTYRHRVGWVRTGGAATFLRTFQRGNRTQYRVIAGSTTPNLPIMASGNSGSPTVPTWTAISVSNYVPTSALSIQGVYGAVTSGGTYSMILAPNNAYGGRDSTSNPPPVKVFMGDNTGWYNIPFDFFLESTDIYYASASLPANNPYVLCTGWVDRANVN